MDEQQRLIKEIESLTNLINTHKQNNEDRPIKDQKPHSYHGPRLSTHITVGGFNHRTYFHNHSRNRIDRQCANVRWRSCESLNSPATSSQSNSVARKTTTGDDVQSHKKYVVDAPKQSGKSECGKNLVGSLTSARAPMSSLSARSHSFGVSVEKPFMKNRQIVPSIAGKTQEGGSCPDLRSASSVKSNLSTKSRTDHSIKSMDLALPTRVITQSQESVAKSLTKSVTVHRTSSMKNIRSDGWNFTSVSQGPKSHSGIPVTDKTSDQKVSQSSDKKLTQDRYTSAANKSASSNIQTSKSKSAKEAAILAAQLAIIEKEMNDAKLKLSSKVRALSENSKKTHSVSKSGILNTGNSGKQIKFSMKTSDPLAPSTSSSKNTDPLAPSTCSSKNTDPLVPSACSKTTDQLASSTCSSKTTDPLAPSTSSLKNTDPLAPSTSSSKNTDPLAPSTSSSKTSDPLVPSTSSLKTSDPLAPSTSSSKTTDPVASSISVIPKPIPDTSAATVRISVSNIDHPKTILPSTSSQSSPNVSKSKSIACVSRYSYVKFAEKFKWFAKGAENDAAVAGAASEHSMSSDRRRSRFNPAKRRSFESALSESIVPLLLSKIEDCPFDESDENAKKVMMQRIQLLENEVMNAKLAKNKATRWRSPRRRQSLVMRSKVNSHWKKSFLKKNQDNAVCSSSDSSIGSALIISPPRPKPNHRFVLNRLSPRNDNPCVSPHKLVRNNSKSNQSSAPTTASEKTTLLKRSDSAVVSASNCRMSTDRKNSIAAAALILNKYKLVRQKTTPQFNITRYKVIRKDGDDAQLGSSDFFGHSSVNIKSANRVVDAGPSHGFSVYRVKSDTRFKPRPSVAHRCKRHQNPGNGGAYALQWKADSISLSPNVRGGKKRRSANAQLQGTNVMWNTGFSLRRDHSDGMSVNQLLGRHVENKSKCRYKFVKAKSRDNTAGSCHSKLKYKVDHRAGASASYSDKSKRRNSGKKFGQRPSLSGYRISTKGRAHRAVVSVRGIKFRVDAQGRTLRRVSSWEYKGNPSRRSLSGNLIYSRLHSVGTSAKFSSSTKITASQSLSRSIARALAAKKKSSKPKERQSCLFYNRFGKCNRGNKCPYVHDPDKVAICTRFLRGTCKVTDCPFSHKVTKERMPVCSHFLRGMCTRENCSYLHVNVGKDAEVCQDFLKGFCSLGEKCKKKHTLTCQEWINTGKCSKNKKCGMNHPQRGHKRLNSSIKGASAEKIKLPPNSPEDDSQPLWKRKRLPYFIPLESPMLDESAIAAETDEEPLKIRPNLSFSEDN